jgi:signal transduction histidine kinase
MKSFKLHIFIRLVITTFLVIWSNRLVAQYFLKEQLIDQVNGQMILALTNCSDHVGDQKLFNECAKKTHALDLTVYLIDHYVLCGTAIPNTKPLDRQLCLNLQDPKTQWYEYDATGSQSMQLAEVLHVGQGWQAFRFKDNETSAQIVLAQNEFDRLLDHMWQLRDRNLLRVLPSILILLGLLSYYMSFVFMRPLKEIEASMSKLSSSNLGTLEKVRVPFLEFDKFVQVFDNLRARLSDSFAKARRFSGDASHELRTPLTILRGNVERMIVDLPKGSDAQVRMRMMGDEVERLIDITEKLLQLSRADASNLLQDIQLLDVSQLLCDVSEEFNSFQNKVRINCDIKPHVSWNCDPVLVRQLIDNLLSNALKYNVPDGWIFVKLSQSADTLELVVENPSRNIPKDLSKRWADRFYRGDASHTRSIDGMGLGLSLCKEIAHVHHGVMGLAVTQSDTVVVTLRVSLKPTQG